MPVVNVAEIIQGDVYPMVNPVWMGMIVPQIGAMSVISVEMILHHVQVAQIQVHVIISLKIPMIRYYFLYHTSEIFRLL